MAPIISPSMLSADFSNLIEDIKLVNESEADWFHLDVMDGVFVPNISFGIPIVKSIKKHATKPLDVHLMIVDPGRYIKAFKDAGSDLLTIHYEASTHLHRDIHEIKKQGMKAGVSLNPHTPVSVLENVIKDLDLVLIMSVNPGFGGQKFIEQSHQKIKTLRQMIDSYNSNCLIEVDGGVDVHNASKLIESGAHALVAGSAVFGSEDPKKTIHLLKNS